MRSLKIRIWLKVKGGALYYSIFIMLLLSMLSLLLLSYFQLSFKEDAIFYKQSELIENLKSAVTLISCKPDLINEGVTSDLDVFNDGSSIVSVSHEPWGMLHKLTLTTSWRKLSAQRAVLMAGKEESRCALWMPDRKKYVSLVGKSYVNGDCYLSELGLRKGNAEGRYFEGNYLHKGEMKVSTEQMPLMRNNKLNYLFNYLDGRKNTSDSIVSYQAIKKNAVVRQSFKAKTLFIESPNRLVLKKNTFSGNVILFTPDTIEIWPSAKIFDAILFAKVIVFKSGCENRIQAFASNSLNIETGCKFSFPSIVGCISHTSNSNVNIKENVVLNGAVINYSQQPEEVKSKLTIGKGSMLYGKFYVNGDVAFNGSIFGSLYCDRFVFSTPRAFYENFIIDAVIDESKLPAQHASFCLEGENVFKYKEVKLCN